MYTESYEIISRGTEWTGKNGNTEKKNQVLTHLHSEDGIHSKELLNLIESFDDSVHRHSGRTCKIIVEFRETNR